MPVYVHRASQEHMPPHRDRRTRVLPPAPNRMPHNPETVMTNARLYKGELASPSRCTSLFTTLLTHSFSASLLT